MGVLSANRKKWLESGQLAVLPAFEKRALDLGRQTITA